MDVPSPSPTASTYDYVYDKDSDSYIVERSQDTTVTKLHWVVLANLVLLLIFCFITILTSGLVFGHNVQSDDCLGQSWVMFSSIMGFLYVALHLHAARKGELAGHVHHPTVQQPLQSSAIVVARIDIVAWAVSLIIVAVSVSKDASPVSCVNLVACAFATPALIFLICVAEKASRPFDLPYITARYSRPPSVVTCRVSALMAAMASTPEVTSEDSISRRGSAVSLPRSHASNIHGSRPNSHTQHAAAIAAAHNASTSGAAVAAAAGGGGHLGGPRAPPSSLKESSASYSFNRFDDRTKRQLADSVSEASQTSESRVRIGGPRPLAASDIAVKTGVLPPPVCTDPREAPQYSQHQHQQHMQQHQQYQPPQQQSYQQYTTDPEKTGSETGVGSGGGGGWKSDWWALRTVAGWVSPAGSGATTPVSTPGVGPSPGPMGGGNSRSRVARLSTVAEDWVPAGGVGRSGSGGRGNGPYSPPTRPPLTRDGARDNGYHDVHTTVDRGAAVPTPPTAVGASPAGRPVRAPTAARVRLVRAQEALKSQARAKSGATVVLTRPGLTGDRREVYPAPTRPSLQSSLSIPGSYVED